MNKSQLVDCVAAQADITKVAAKKAIDAFIDIIGESLSKGDKVSIIGFGAFVKAQKQGRIGRNPKTGAQIKIAPKKVVKFTPGADLNAKVNS